MIGQYTINIPDIFQVFTVFDSNLLTNEEKICNSLYALYKDLDINAEHVKMICENLNHCKSATSKRDGNKYTFKNKKKLILGLKKYFNII